MKKILVVGLGNVLLQDEGIGIHVLERLEKEGGLPNEVELIRGETGGLALLPSLDEAYAIIFIDAAEFEGETGDIKIFRGDEIQKGRYTTLSVHDIGLRDIISLILLKDSSPPKIVIVGIKPKDLSEGSFGKVGTKISSDLEKAIPSAVKIIREEILRLSINLRKEEK